MQDDEFILVERPDTRVVVTPQEQVVTAVVQEATVVSVEKDLAVTVEVQETHVIAVGQQGPAGPPGTGGGGEVFILDVTPTSSGIVGSKTYVPNTVPANVELATALSDTTNVRVHVGCEGGADSYSPVIEINGVQATLTESSTKRWFTGYADVVLTGGIVNTITATSDAGGSDTVDIEVLGAGPEILSITFGAYPGTQTELKMGDTISVTVNTEAEATSVTILASGATTGATLAVTGGVASGAITIANTSGSQTITARAKNSFGTFGNDFVSTPLTLNQTYPTIGGAVVAYSNGLSAMGAGETANVTMTITNADVVSYTSAYMTIDQPSVYAATKTVTNTFSGYYGSGANYFVTATRTANNATTNGNALVKIATTPASAAISIVPSGRLVSSPTGISYEVRITPDQTITAVGSLTASHGSWSGSWTNMGGYWKRTLVIADSVPRGTGVFSSLSITGLSGITGTSITSGSNYTVGGFSSRNVTFPAFSRVAPIGVAVADQTKTTAQVAGGAVLTRYTDNAIHTNGYYIANADGSYNPTGSYIGLSDSVFAGSNTSGTLQAIIQEVA